MSVVRNYPPSVPNPITFFRPSQREGGGEILPRPPLYDRFVLELRSRLAGNLALQEEGYHQGIQAKRFHRAASQ